MAVTLRQQVAGGAKVRQRPAPVALRPQDVTQGLVNLVLQRGIRQLAGPVQGRPQKVGVAVPQAEPDRLCLLDRGLR